MFPQFTSFDYYVTPHFMNVCACILSNVWLCNCMTVAPQVPLSLEFPRKEYWSGLQFPTPKYLPDLGIEPTSLVSPVLAGRFFTTSAIWKPLSSLLIYSLWVDTWVVSKFLLLWTVMLLIYLFWFLGFLCKDISWGIPMSEIIGP